jgi:hypothetical protein
MTLGMATAIVVGLLVYVLLVLFIFPRFNIET